MQRFQPFRWSNIASCSYWGQLLRNTPWDLCLSLFYSIIINFDKFIYKLSPVKLIHWCCFVRATNKKLNVDRLTKLIIFFFFVERDQNKVGSQHQWMWICVCQKLLLSFLQHRHPCWHTWTLSLWSFSKR